ncbi:MAG TPA: hypothetical protein VEQ37_18485 [Actinomycetota bacterium]|nr:hypothetical protein [Actinomycetota bacterium]
MRPIKLRTIAVLGALVLPLRLLTSGANAVRAEQPGPTLYNVTQLGSLGETTSAGNGINNRDWITGFSNLPGDEATHATLWRDQRPRSSTRTRIP